MKPTGLSAAFQIIKSDRVQDVVYEAVQAAIDAGWTVEQFRAEAAECWDICRREQHQHDQKSWTKEIR